MRNWDEWADGRKEKLVSEFLQEGKTSYDDEYIAWVIKNIDSAKYAHAIDFYNEHRKKEGSFFRGYVENRIWTLQDAEHDALEKGPEYEHEDEMDSK